MVAVLLLIATSQAWFVSHGEMTRWYTFTDYYSLLAEAFTNGQTSLLLRPDPRLSTLLDPYDPAANFPYRLHDALFYEGEYFLYWGPAPAVVLAALQKITALRPGDQFLTFAALFGTVLLTALILAELNRYREILPEWLAAFGVLSLGLSGPATMLLSRAAIYEAAIAWGQFGLFLGLYVALTALRTPGLSRCRLGVTGFAWALACCSRLSVTPAVLGLTVILALEIVRRTRGTVPRLFRLGLVLTPVLLGGAGLALYNHARFGVWHEFGLRYQLTDAVLHTADLSGSFAFANLMPSLQAYALGPIDLSSDFPFCIPSVSRWVTGEPVAGVIYVLPYLLLALPLLLPIRRPKPHGGEASVCRERWLIGSLLCLALLSAAPVLLAVGGPQNRYLVDIIPALLLLATLGGCRAWILLQFHRRVVVAAITGLCLISVLAGVSLGTFWTQYAAPYRLKTPSAWYPP